VGSLPISICKTQLAHLIWTDYWLLDRVAEHYVAQSTLTVVVHVTTLYYCDFMLRLLHYADHVSGGRASAVCCCISHASVWTGMRQSVWLINQPGGHSSLLSD
jgi:hypothetical protein